MIHSKCNRLDGPEDLLDPVTCDQMWDSKKKCFLYSEPGSEEFIKNFEQRAEIYLRKESDGFEWTMDIICKDCKHRKSTLLFSGKLYPRHIHATCYMYEFPAHKPLAILNGTASCDLFEHGDVPDEVISESEQ